MNSEETTKVITRPEKIASPIIEDSNYVDPNFGPSDKPWSTQVPNVAKSNNHDKYPNGYIIEPPTENPLTVYNKRSCEYPEQQKVMPEKYAQLPPDGQGNDREKSLEIMKNYYTNQRDEFIGYQCVEQFNISKEMSSFLNMSLNNIGDPFKNGYFTVNAKQAERGVLDFFASLWHAQWPSLPKPKRDSIASDTEYLTSTEYEKYKESYWGYVLSMGSTEGNLYAVLSARDYLSGYSLVVDEMNEETLCPPKISNNINPNKYTPVAFYSEAAHYSLAKAVHAMQMKTFAQIAHEKGWKSPLGDKWPDTVPVDEHGSVIIEDLVILVKFFTDKGYVPFICFNYGTTFKGAYDDIPTACEKLQPIFKANNLINREVFYLDSNRNIKKDHRRGYWIHVDGALGASLMPFVEMAVENNRLNKSELAPCFDFRNKEVMSIVTSGHKWPSASAPTGIYMTKNKYLITPVATPDYLGSPDTTFAGSRNGLSAMILWNLIANGGINGFVDRSVRTMELCRYAEDKFKELQSELNNLNIWLQRAPNGGTSLIFRKPIDEIMFKYSLPIEIESSTGTEGIRKRTFVHLFVFWDRDKHMIDDLINDLKQEGAFGNPDDTEQFIPHSQNRRVYEAYPSMKLLKRSIHKGFR